jgi:choline dehydrogenase-like flavoprotein
MPDGNNQFDFDFIVIGSGSAHRLMEKGYRVAVMEMGRRWTAKSKCAGNVPGFGPSGSFS